MSHPTSAESSALLRNRLLPDLKPGKKESGTPYLKFLINLNTPALLPMKDIQEATVLPSRLLATMPNMPPYILGLANRRSRVIWVIDLSQVLGLEEISFISQNHDAIIVKNGLFWAALAIYKIEGIVRFEDDVIKSTPSYISPTLTPYMNGYISQNDNMSLLLNVEAIAQSPLLQNI
ncbi:MAG: chemotaxis protein CheW [Leptolyngbyaceae bacterium]|nr:chemotaxis protein CheW [Leptolyngbyaceae bacterium]